MKTSANSREVAEQAVAADAASATEETAERPAARAAASEAEPAGGIQVDAEVASAPEDGEARVHRTRRRAEAEPTPQAPVVVSSGAETGEADAKPKKGGWWQRKSFF